ncbi:hypothetical protein Hanom_Chr00s000090g01619341 [Helianthus anomalus]
MANQGFPFPPFGLHSKMGTAVNNSHVQNQPIDEYVKGECTYVGAMRASGTRTAQTGTPTNQGAGPSAPGISRLPVMSGLLEGETPASWYAKSQATMNLIYAQLCAQQGPTQAQT